jgi:hypothetical protein
MKTFEFKLGSDPELQLLRQGVQVQAETAITCMFHPDHSKNGMGYEIEGAGVVGWDGASAPAELRPNPTNDPAEATRFVGTLLAEMHRKLPGIDITTLSLNCRVGGHIQVDFPNELLKNDKVRNRIDLLMATFVLPLFCSDHQMSSNYRRTNYGDADDFRTEERNSETHLTTFEIRGPSAEWLVSPKMTMATLSYIGVVWSEVLKNHERLIKHRDVFKTSAQISGVQEAVLSGYRSVQETVIRRIHRMVKTFDRYQDFQSEIDFILSPRRVIAHKQALKWLPKNGWKLGEQKQPTKKQVLSLTADQLPTLAHPEFVDRTYGMPFNDDLNVKALMQLLARRTYALNLDLKHSYFFFGLKKGMDQHLVATIEGMGDKQNLQLLQKPNSLNFKESLRTAKKMGERVLGHLSRANTQRFDARTARLVPVTHRSILIGIPYEERKAITNTQSALKPFAALMQLIWKLEQGVLQPLQSDPAEAETEKTMLESLTGVISTLGELDESTLDEITPTTSCVD